MRKTWFWLFAVILITHESSVGRLIWQDAVFAAGPSPLAGSQQAPAPSGQKERPTVRLESRLIQLSAFVTDKRGRPVTDLRRQDFVLLEDGVPQKVRYFSVESFDLGYELPRQAHQPPQRPLPATAAARRTILLLVDDLHISAENMTRVKQALRDFIDHETRDEDEVAVVTSSGSLGFLQQLTDDRAALRLAVERLSGKASAVRLSQDRLYLTPYQADLIARRDPQALDAAVAELRAKTPGLLQAQIGREQLESRAISLAQRVLQSSEQRALSSIDTLSNAIRSLQRQQGAKLAILISDGFFMSASLDQARPRLRRVIDAATRARVVVYTIDARGLQANLSDLSITTGDVTPGLRHLRQVSQPAERTAFQDALRLIARDTGGRAFLNQNDLKAGFEHVLAENNFFYSLGYLPSEAKPGKPTFRHIDVRIKGRPELLVRFQRGYLAAAAGKPKAARPPEVPQNRLRRALLAITPYHDIGVSARANFINTAQQGSLIIAAIQINAHSLQFKQVNGRQQAQLELSGVFYNAQGRVAHSFSKKLSLNLERQTYQKILRQGFQHIEHFQPSPGLYQIRIAVQEVSTGRLGSTSQRVWVPDLSQGHMELSDIFFLTNVTTADGLMQERGPRLIIKGKLMMPTVRVVEEKSRLDFGFYVYNAAPTASGRPPDLVVQVQVMRNNVPVLTSPLQSIPTQLSPDPQRIFFGSRLPLGPLPPGQYLLQVTVIDRVSRQPASKRIDFTII